MNIKVVLELNEQEWAALKKIFKTTEKLQDDYPDEHTAVEVNLVSRVLHGKETP